MEISGPTPYKPNYRDEFRQSVNLFEKSFQQMQKASFEAKKDQYVKVMHESLNIMQDTANAMVNKHLTEMKEKLSTDLNQYLTQPTDDNRKQVESDIQSLKIL